MNNRSILKLIFGGMSFFMICLVIITSLQSNILVALPQLSAFPWFTTTIVDFYFNIAIISVWVLYREKNILIAICWVLSFIFLGSITTCFYVLLQLMKLKPNESLDQVLLRKV